MTILTEITARQQEKEVVINENFEAVSPAGLFGIDWENTEDLTLGIFGGRFWDGSAFTLLADTTVALSASQTNYVEATTAGVVSANTSAFTAGRIKLFTVTTTASGVDVVTDYRAFPIQGANIIISGPLNDITYLGLGGPSVTTYAIQVANTNLTGAVQRGIFSNPTGSSAGTTQIAGVFSQVKTAAAAFTVTTAMGFGVANAVIGAGSAITTQIGYSCNDLSGATNNYGFRIAQSAGANNYSLYLDGGAQSVHTGKFRIGSSVAPTVELDVTGSAAFSTWAKVGSYTVGTLPSAATAGAGAMAWCSNETGGAVLVTSNGTNWKLAGTQTTAS